MPWKDLERQGWSAQAVCTEVRVTMAPEERLEYAASKRRQKFRLASENTRKIAPLETLLRAHADEPTLIIGMYLDQLPDAYERHAPQGLGPLV